MLPLTADLDKKKMDEDNKLVSVSVLAFDYIYLFHSL